MLFVYECTENIIAEFEKFYDTQLSEEQKKRIFVPTYRTEAGIQKLFSYRMQRQR